MRIGIAHQAFFGSFADFYPDLKLIKDSDDVKNYDLIIFSGGEDIDPQIYHEENVSSYFSPERDAIEIPILDRAIRLGKKILGVCRGHQLINAYLGGSLYQDISMVGMNHRGSHGWKALIAHTILNILPGTINSMHHQGVKNCGDGMKIITIWNSIPEVMTSTDNSIITVQFHPEFMGLTSFFEYITQWSLETTKKVASIKREKYTRSMDGPTYATIDNTPVVSRTEQPIDWNSVSSGRSIDDIFRTYVTSSSTNIDPEPDLGSDPENA